MMAVLSPLTEAGSEEAVPVLGPLTETGTEADQELDGTAEKKREAARQAELRQKLMADAKAKAKTKKAKSRSAMAIVNWQCGVAVWPTPLWCSRPPSQGHQTGGHARS